jgi:hypothetical protein
MKIITLSLEGTHYYVGNQNIEECIRDTAVLNEKSKLLKNCTIFKDLLIMNPFLSLKNIYTVSQKQLNKLFAGNTCAHTVTEGGA